MQSRHDFETESAIACNVQDQMLELWNLLVIWGCDRDRKAGVRWGACVYRMPAQIFRGINWLFGKAEFERRVIRIPLAIWEARGCTFKKPRNYMERRESDRRSVEGYLSAHRIQAVKQNG